MNILKRKIMLTDEILKELNEVGYFALNDNETFASLSFGDKFKYLISHRTKQFFSAMSGLVVVLSVFFFFKSFGFIGGLEEIGILEKFDESKAKEVLVATIASEFDSNQPNTIKKYNNGVYKVVGLYYKTDVDGTDSSKELVILTDGDSGRPFYTKLDKKFKHDLYKPLKRGQLVQIFCRDFSIFGTGPVFTDCRWLSAYPIPPGERADIFYDKLLYENNPLLNSK